MNWSSFLTYGHSHNHAFEIFCNQLFERFLRREFGSKLVKFRVINGAGGDGGIEAYGEIDNADLIVVQSKWFPTVVGNDEIKQIRKSVETALMHFGKHIVQV